MQQSLLQINNLTVAFAGNTVLCDVSIKVEKGESLAVVGPSGSGKSTLLKALANNLCNSSQVVFAKKNYTTPQIAIVSQQHVFKNLSNTTSFYYQQRFNSNDAQDAITVKEALIKINDDVNFVNGTMELLGILQLTNTRLLQLSNGEHKRFQLAKALLADADWILLDSPYTGLDADARKMLNLILEKLISKGFNIILATSSIHLPGFITHVAFLKKGMLNSKVSRKIFETNCATERSESNVSASNITIEASLPSANEYQFSVAVKMIDTTVMYGDKNILSGINWKVNKGECWNVSGRNGSGKSTLLSLITGDNPQAFANEIYLFDKRKGSGESIWDIKEKIGYLSPELHHYFDTANTCFQVVASGLFDTIGLFKNITISQRALVDEWMSMLKISDFARMLFKQLSYGEQQLVLLARALVKNPPLLILDEPCQGLDDEVKPWFLNLITSICIQLKKTLIYVSHYQDEIPSCITHTLQLQQGKIAA